MSRIALVIEGAGLDVVAPSPDGVSDNAAIDSAMMCKREASRRHMQQIRNPETAAVLVVNVDRPGAHDYIGPNALAEIGVAFADERKVFLLQGMPKPYEDELKAWGVTCLNGDLRPMLRALSAPAAVDWTAWKHTLESELVC
jgi:hypothetical protein